MKKNLDIILDEDLSLNMKLATIIFALPCLARIASATVDIECLNEASSKLKHAVMMSPDDSVIPDEFKNDFIKAVSECGENVTPEDFDDMVEDLETMKHLQDGEGDRKLACYPTNYKCSSWFDCAWGCCGGYTAVYNYNYTKATYYCKCYAKGTAPFYVLASTCNSACCIKCHYEFNFFGQSGYFC